MTTATISSFTVSPDNKLWIGTGEGIFVLDGEGYVTRYTENNSRLCGGVVTGIMFDRNGNGWVGSQGLSLYVGATNTFENTHFPKGFFNGEANLGCIMGHDDLIYFIRQSKVFYTNPAMSKFGQLELPTEQQNTTCYGFLDDRRGSFWFATDGGLYRTNYQMRDLQHFGYGEGLMCQYINSNGVQMDATGTVWIGTSNGLMRVDNKAMQRWQHNTEFHISLYNVRKGSDLVNYDEEDEINTDRRIYLSSSRLSQVFSLYLGENYYEFINGYRLREFKRLIADGAYNKYTLTALSEQCGFKKSSFFSTFRRVEGMTPTEYLKKQNIQL